MSPKTHTRLLAAWVATALLLPPAFTQSKGGTTGTTATGSTGATTGSTGSTVSRTTTTNPSTQTNQNTQPQQTIFLSGRVQLEDGSVPPGQVVIERVCNGAAHSEGYADAKGYFGIQLGAQNTGMVQDASESSRDLDYPGSRGTAQSTSGFGTGGNSVSFRMQNCELRARLAGYRSQTVNLLNRRSLDDPNVGVILLHREGPSEDGTTVSAVSLAAPKDARKAFDKGRSAAQKKKWDEAALNYEKAVELYPKYATAWHDLGVLQVSRGDTDAARKSFAAALAADPKYLAPSLQISVLDLRQEKWQDAADTTARIIRLDAFDYPQAFFFNAIAQLNLKNVDAAEKSLRETERLDTRHQFPRTLQLLGVILAQRRDYTGAAGYLRGYLKLVPDAPDAGTVRAQLDQIEKITAQAAPKP